MYVIFKNKNYLLISFKHRATLNKYRNCYASVCENKKKCCIELKSENKHWLLINSKVNFLIKQKLIIALNTIFLVLSLL